MSRAGRETLVVAHSNYGTGSQSELFSSTLIEKGSPERTYVPKLHNETNATTILTPTGKNFASQND